LTLKKPDKKEGVKHDDGSALIGPAEVARLLGVSSGWVRDHATRKTPRIPVVRIGRMMRFRPADIKGIVQHGFTSENWRTNGEQF
jgi:hypothetical protein